MTTKILAALAGVLFFASLFLLFIGLDSRPDPTLMALATAGIICMVASCLIQGGIAIHAFWSRRRNNH